MDLTEGHPLKLQQDIELQGLWLPAAPAKTTSTRRPLASTPSYGQTSGQICLDPLVTASTGLLGPIPPWEFAFQNQSSRSLLGTCVPDHAPAIAESSARRTSVNSFMLSSPAGRCGNIGSIRWSPELCGNAQSSAAICGMPPAVPTFSQIVGEEETNDSINKFLLKGKVLLDGSSWSVQKTQYKSPVTCQNYLNSFQGMSYSGISEVPNSAIPLIMEKCSKRSQDEQQALAVTGSVHEDETEENSLNKKVSPSKQVFDSPDASFSNLMALAYQRAFYKNPENPKQIAALPSELTDKLEGKEIVTNERGNEDRELSNNASKQKPKRKKHRPNVIIEGKSARTPKPTTPMAKTPKQDQNQVSASGKRKYVRRKSLPSFEASQNELSNNVESESRSQAKPVRRSLNFDLEGEQTSEKYSALMLMHNQVKENPVQVTRVGDSLTGSRLMKTVDDIGEQVPVVENLLTRLDFGVVGSTNQAANELSKLLQQQPQVPPLMGKQNMGSLSKKNIYKGSLTTF